MIDITKIHLYYRNFSGRLFHKQVKPSDAEDADALKADIRKMLSKVNQSRYEYYYVIFEIDVDGETAYANAVQKTFFEESDGSELDKLEDVLEQDEEKYMSGTTLR